MKVVLLDKVAWYIGLRYNSQSSLPDSSTALNLHSLLFYCLYYHCHV